MSFIKNNIPVLIALVFIALAISACSTDGKRKNTNMDTEKTDGDRTYGQDVEFFKENQIDFFELRDKNDARVLLVPAYQGRVMTSSANGDDGYSFGWINYRLISSGKVNTQFNPYGGEERFWLGPEGGPFSVYFRKGDEQVFSNWKVPDVIDTEKFELEEKSNYHVKFTKDTELVNASGSVFSIGIKREVSLLSRDTLSVVFGADFPESLSIVAYQSENTITNRGKEAWKKENGLLSIWMLSMFNPTPATTVFIPFRNEGDGVIVNDDYFGKVPEDRLQIRDSTIYFKIDGKYRSKIGLPPQRAKGICGSFDGDKNTLTLLWCSQERENTCYVNSKWGEQEDPYAGDVINSYNDGPVEDGSIMGPFYEIESSSHAAALQPGASLIHIQRIVHIQGDRAELNTLVQKLFDLDLEKIEAVF